MSALTSATNVKNHLGISVTTFDTELDVIVDGVNAAIENFLDVEFDSTVYTDEEYDTINDRRLVLKHRPVITFTRLQYKDDPADFDDDNWTNIDSGEYVADLESGIVTWNSNFLPGKRRYRATYTAGYASIPADVTLAATILAASLFNNRKQANITSETLGQYSRTYANDPSNWKKLGMFDLINKYKVRNVSWFGDAFRPGNDVPPPFNARSFL